MNLLLILTSFLFFIWVIRNILFWVYLWQLKEYRLDRLIVHLKETAQGRFIIASPLLVLTWIAIFSYTFVISDHNLLLLYQLFTTLVFSFKAISVTREFNKQAIKRPILTFKAAFVIMIVSLSVLLLYLFPLVERFLWLLLLDRLVPVLTTTLILLLSVPTEFYRDLKIERAIKKIKKCKKLLVIGVTGSYGKSSTKDFTAQILGKKFRVLKTSGTNNTPIGIAHTILTGLKQSTEIFVVEMGAYRKGEIAEICQIVYPQIGVLSGINDQHLSLFGSMENIMSAKYELIESLPKNGLAIFNGNNSNARLLYNRTKKRKVLYQWGEKLTDQDIYAYNITVKKTFITFDVVLKNKTIHFKTHLIGGQNVENILPAIYTAHYLGMNEAQIKKAVLGLIGLPKTMTLHKIPHGPFLIDDTFNANPASMTAIINYMKLYKSKKFLVLTPMIELGNNANEEHYTVGRQVSKVCDYVFLTNKNFGKNVFRGIRDEGGKCKMRVSNANDAAQFISTNTAKDDIVGFEGKEANIVLEKIL